MNSAFERVHTVVDYYDGPRSGVADFQGAPHVYRALFSEAADDWEDDLFELSPLSAEASALALEDWDIWKRFERQYQVGEVTWSGREDEWGALPQDRPRQREIRSLLEPALAINPQHRVVARGEFRVIEPVSLDSPQGVLRPLEVRWIPVE